MSKKIIIAIVGMCGSGKSTATDVIKNCFEVETIYLGGLVFKELDRRGLERNPENEKIVREELRKNEGMGVIAKLVMPDINKMNSSIILDGLYSFSEYEILKKCYNLNFKVIAIHADKELRYNRLSARKDRPLLPDQVDSRDNSEIRNLEKGGPIAIADFHIINNGNQDEFKSKLLTCVNNIIPINYSTT